MNVVKKQVTIQSQAQERLTKYLNFRSHTTQKFFVDLLRLRVVLQILKVLGLAVPNRRAQIFLLNSRKLEISKTVLIRSRRKFVGLIRKWRKYLEILWLVLGLGQIYKSICRDVKPKEGISKLFPNRPLFGNGNSSAAGIKCLRKWLI